MTWHESPGSLRPLDRHSIHGRAESNSMREEHKLHPMAYLSVMSPSKVPLLLTALGYTTYHQQANKKRKDEKKPPLTPLQISPWSPPTHMTVRGPSKPDPRADAGGAGRQRGRPIGTRLQAPRTATRDQKCGWGRGRWKKKKYGDGAGVGLGWVGRGGRK